MVAEDELLDGLTTVPADDVLDGADAAMYQDKVVRARRGTANPAW